MQRKFMRKVGAVITDVGKYCFHCLVMPTDVGIPRAK